MTRAATIAMVLAAEEAYFDGTPDPPGSAGFACMESAINAALAVATPDERAALLFGLEAAVYDEFHEITPRDGWIINKARDLAAAALREPVGERLPDSVENLTADSDAVVYAREVQPVGEREALSLTEHGFADWVGRKLLAAHDAFVQGDEKEAYHCIYGIVDPMYTKQDPWGDLALALRATTGGRHE